MTHGDTTRNCDARLREISDRLHRLDRTHRGRDYPADARTEVERLEAEAEALLAGVER